MTENLLTSEMLAKIIDGSPIPSFVINDSHQITHWNTALEALTGIVKDDIIGTDRHWQPFYGEKRPLLADFIVDEASATQIEGYYPGYSQKSPLIKGAYEAEDFFPTLGKKGRWLHFTASPIRSNGGGAIIGAIETIEDATVHKVAQQALHDSEKRFRALFEGAYDAIWVHDMKGNILTANSASAKLSGYSMDELLKMNVKSFLTEESMKMARLVRVRLNRKQPLDSPYEQKIIRKDGSEAICMVTTSLISLDGQTKALQNMARDVTEEKRMQENLHYYLQLITKAQEEERRRIARELHDDTVQVLGSLSRQLDNFIRKSRKLSAKDIDLLKDLQSQLNNGIKDVHRFSQALRLSILDDLGLVPALRSLTKTFEERHEVAAELKVTGSKERRYPSEVELTLFRIVQEAYTNIGRHAQASQARVIMDSGEHSVKVTISDNGKGLEISGPVGDLPRDGKLGLAGIQERVRLLGGSFNVKSAPGDGVEITVEVPI